MMKKLIAAALLIVGMTAFAQEVTKVTAKRRQGRNGKVHSGTTK
ncbi:hypothetical protein [Flavobacterium sp. 3HN19-14]